MQESVSAFNGVGRPYKIEASLILITNAWELLAKAVLVRNHQSIHSGKGGETISAQVAVSRLRSTQVLDENQEDCIQQIISLRDCAVHSLLPEVPEEILHHLMFFSCKSFREVIRACFPAYSRHLVGNYLSLAFSDLTTYADKVQKLVAKVRRVGEAKKLVWLLERGIQFDGTKYVSQKQFESQYRRKSRILPHLAISNFLKTADMVRIVPIQAPRSFTADINLRKGNSADASLPVVIKKTDVEADYPYLTREIGEKLGKNSNFVASTIKFLGLKGNSQFHQSVRASKKSMVHRYSEAALEKLKKFLSNNSSFNPYEELRRIKAQQRTSTEDNSGLSGVPQSSASDSRAAR